jgi:hypothetical protein
MATEYDRLLFEPAELVKKLNGRRFVMDDLQVVGLSAETVENYIHKSKLLMCSENPGRGRARKFCLLDVYLLALKSHIVVMTGSALAASKALKELVLEPLQSELSFKKPTEAKIAEYLDEVCDEITIGPQLFYERGLSHWYIYTSTIEHGFKAAIGFDPMNDRELLTQARCMFLNVTTILEGVDRHLLRALRERYGDI